MLQKVLTQALSFTRFLLTGVAQKTIPIKISCERKYTVNVVAVSYQRLGELKVFVQSWINQTEKNWTLLVIHDGEDEEFLHVMEEFRVVDPLRISYRCSKTRFNDYGHSLREIGLKDATGDYVLITNADNYYVPRALHFFNEAFCKRSARFYQRTLEKPDVVICDMVHSHQNPGARRAPSYSYFQVSYKRNEIDMGAAIVERKLAQQSGFKDKSFSADASYFEAVLSEKKKMNGKLFIIKIPRVLLVHN